MSQQSRAVLYVVIVFFIGVVTGALAMNVIEHVWIHPHGINVTAASLPATRPSDKDRYVEQFKKELNLTDDQSKELESILDETMRQYDDLHSFSHHIRDDGIARIRAMLTDTQRQKFDQITRRMDDSAKKPARK